MKYFKITTALISFLIITNIVIAENHRTRANPDVNAEARNVEDRVNDSSLFISINPGDNAVEMSSNSKRVKNNTVTTLATGLVQAQSNRKDVVKKYNRFSDKQGEKKNKKNI